MAKKRILTGDRPTGRLHLGHYVGSLKNRIKLQDEYECFFIIADLHTLTTRPEKTAELKENIRQLVLDYLAVGIDPAKSTIYVQSQVPEVGELAVIFGNLVTVPRLQRVPTLKDVMRDSHITIPSLGLLGYPVLQSADILMVRANLVPVGRDQTSHIEVTREIAREFNRLYPLGTESNLADLPSSKNARRGSNGGSQVFSSASLKSASRKNSSDIKSQSARDSAMFLTAGKFAVADIPGGYSVFPIPEALIPDDIGTLPGTDGKAKMSKSAGNVINLSDPPEVVRKQVMGMYTDPARVHGDEPGDVEGNPVFVYLDAFSQSEKSKLKVEELKKRYQKGTVKDVEVKEFLVQVLEEFLVPIRKKQAGFEKQPELIDQILIKGTARARTEAQETLDLVRRAMGIDYFG